MQGIGYKEILGYLNGEYDLPEAIRILKRDTRHFAKRQLTWFRRERDVIWLDKDILKHRPEAGRCNHDASCREKYTIILQ